jgi:charged multivesicular body protein 7
MSSSSSSPDLLVLNVDEELLRALECKEWGRPLALGTVVHDLIMRKEMMPLQEFLSFKETIYSKNWTSLPWNILRWGFKQLGLTGGQHCESNLSMGKLVIIPNLEEACEKIGQRVARQTSRTDKVYSKRLFNKEFAGILGSKHLMSQADIDALLKFMARDMHTLAYDGQTIKFKEPLETRPTIITHEDTTIALLRTLKVDVENQINVLAHRVETLSQTARHAVERKNRMSAIVALRSKKLAESNLSKQATTLAQLEEIYSKINQAADQVGLIRIMEGSARVLKFLNAQVGGIERVEDVVDELGKQISRVGEVHDVIAEAGQSGSATDEDQLDVELEAMERDEREKKEAAEHIDEKNGEQEQNLETRQKLADLEEVERMATRNRKENNNKPTELSRLANVRVTATVDSLKEMQLEEKQTRIAA